MNMKMREERSEQRRILSLSALTLYLVSPIVLGSWWAVIPALVIIPVIVFRILDEE